MPKPCPVCGNEPIEANTADIDEDEPNWIVGCVNDKCEFSCMYFDPREWETIDKARAKQIIMEANA